jgi:signal transduction histidine kinase
MRRASQQCGELEHLIGRRELVEVGDSLWSDGTEPETHFANGTREMDRLCVEAVDEAATILELSTIPQPLFVIGPDGIIEDLNSPAAALVGFERDAIVGRSVRFLVSGIALPADRIRSICGCVRHRDGAATIVDVLLCPHRDQATLAVITPRIHERGHNAEVVQLVHDLKNPLATIALEMCILEGKLDRTDLKGAVTRVTQNVAYLDRMVQDLLDADAMDVDRFALHRRPVDMQQLIERVIERATATRDRARVHLDARSSVVLMIDDLRIERVIANLLGNALKYSPSTTDVIVRLETHHDIARVSVIDAGPGIAPEEAAQLFGKYRRATTSHGHEGSGLGLYVSKRIVEAHGGRIGVDSLHGVGSCFFFELPLAA